MEKREAEGTKPAGRGREKGEARKKDPDGRKRVEEVRGKEGEGKRESLRVFLKSNSTRISTGRGFVLCPFVSVFYSFLHFSSTPLSKKPTWSSLFPFLTPKTRDLFMSSS